MKKTGIMYVYDESPENRYETFLENSVELLIQTIKKKIITNSFIIDDASEDNTFDYVRNKIKDFPEIILLQNKKALGKAKIFLNILKRMKEDEPYIIFNFDSDIKECAPEEISRVIQVLETKDKSMVYTKYMHTNGEPLWFSAFSGLRAIRFSALECLYNPRHEEYLLWKKAFEYDSRNEGYRLERVLNDIIPLCEKDFIEINAVLRTPGKGKFKIKEINTGIESYSPCID